MGDYCPFCHPNTGGQHEEWCPNSRLAQPLVDNGTYAASALQGWVCPRCGRVWAPWVQACDCVVLISGPTNFTISTPEDAENERSTSLH